MGEFCSWLLFDVKFSQQQRLKYEEEDENKINNQERPAFGRRSNTNQQQTKLSITNKHNRFNLNQTPLQTALPVDNQRFASENVEENGCNYCDSEIDYGGGRGYEEDDSVCRLDAFANKCQPMIVSIENTFNGHLMKNTNESASNTSTMR